jgi:adenylate cyclase
VDAPLTDARVLVADHASGARQQLRAVLGDAGCEVVEASDGPECLRLCEEGTFELILLDVNLPGMDGITVCKSLRAEQRTADVPILIMTALSKEHVQLSALHAGADDTISKPLNRPVLLARASAAVRRYRAEEANKRLLGETRRYVSPAAARQMSEHRPPEAIQAAMMFSDLRAFTSTCSVLPLEVTFRALGRIYEAHVRVVRQHGGYVDKFAGDGVLAVFEGPQACRQACEGVRDLLAWCTAFEGPECWTPTPIGMGVAYGEVMRGDLGGHHRTDFTVIGPTVNLAARLCGAAGRLEALVTSNVVERAGAPFTAAPEKALRVRGLTDEVLVRLFRSADQATGS